MKNGRLQCKDIPDRMFLAAVDRYEKKHNSWVCYWVMVEEERWTFDKELVLAKAEKLIDRKLMTGCPCGCRGDFEMTGKGDDYLAAHCNLHDDCLRHDDRAKACLKNDQCSTRAEGKDG